MPTIRLGSFNVENLFARPKAMNLPWDEGGPILRAHAELTDLLGHEVYSDADKARILQLCAELGILDSDEGPMVRLRKVRGQLLSRPRNKPPEVVADGRTTWTGWVELKTATVNALAMRHTAMVIKEVNADVLGVVEADNRPDLELFTSSLLPEVEGVPYPETHLVEGMDTRGIDVGLLTRHRVTNIRTHIYDTDKRGVVFSRDCSEYHVDVGAGKPLVVLVNHFKSKGYSEEDDPIGFKRRKRQASRVAAIYEELRAAGHKYTAVVGDLNDSPSGGSLRPLLDDTTLRDISEHANFRIGERKGTYGSTNADGKIDYVLLSPALFKRATGGAVFRKGVWRSNRARKPLWEIFPTMTSELHAASDHAAIYADIALP